MPKTTPTKPADRYIPPYLIEQTRDWAWHEFEFGEWFPFSVITDYIRANFGYSKSTPQQYASRFIHRGVANGDFEIRVRQWRWKIHPQPGDPGAEPTTASAGE